MPLGGGLSPNVAAGVVLSATMSRNSYTTDPNVIVDELREVARGRDHVLA